MPATRKQIVKLWNKARNQKRKQSKSDMRRERTWITCVHAWKKKKLQWEFEKQEIFHLSQKVIKLKRKVAFNENEVLKIFWWGFAYFHWKQQSKDLLNDKFFVKQLNLIDFYTFVLEVSEKILLLNWYGEERTYYLSSKPISFLIMNDVFLILF
jgi:hypothetical protein